MRRIHGLLNGKPDEALAVIDFDGETSTYRQLKEMSKSLADILREYGVRGGDRIVLVAENSSFYAASVFAASRLYIYHSKTRTF